MHVRRRLLSAGAVLAAAAGVVLSASPAQADCDLAERSSAQWQVGMQLGSAPVSLTGAGGLPAVLLGTLPASTVAVQDAHGQTLLRLNASSRLPAAPRPTYSGNLTPDRPEELPDGLHRDGLHRDGPAPAVRESAARPAPAGAMTAAAARRAAAVDRAAEATAAVPAEVPLQTPGADSVLGGRYAWVPIEGVAGLGSDAGGAPWAAGLALVVLAGGAGAVTVIARHRRISAG